MSGFEPSRADCEDLADLERVVAGVAEDRRRREVVVEHEGVVAVAAEDLDAAVDLAVVVDALEDAARNELAVRPTSNAATIALRSTTVGRLGAQQEEVGVVGAVDPEDVDAGVAGDWSSTSMSVAHDSTAVGARRSGGGVEPERPIS